MFIRVQSVQEQFRAGWTRTIQDVTFPRFFNHRLGERKSTAISKLALTLSTLSRSCTTCTLIEGTHYTRKYCMKAHYYTDLVEGGRTIHQGERSKRGSTVYVLNPS